jgi:hypothetical protein
VLRLGAHQTKRTLAKVAADARAGKRGSQSDFRVEHI